MQNQVLHVCIVCVAFPRRTSFEMDLTTRWGAWAETLSHDVAKGVVPIVATISVMRRRVTRSSYVTTVVAVLRTLQSLLQCQHIALATRYAEQTLTRSSHRALPREGATLHKRHPTPRTAAGRTRP